MTGATDKRVQPEVLARRTVASNARFDLRFDHLRSANGEEVPNYLVVAPLVRSFGGHTGVAILPVVDGMFVLQRMYRHPVQGWGWEVPRGFVDNGETAIAAAQRELGEETGLYCPADRFLILGEIWPEPGIIDGCILMVAATACRPDPKLMCAELGRDTMAFFSKDSIMAMSGTPQIRCGTTMSCLFRYFAQEADVVEP